MGGEWSGRWAKRGGKVTVEDCLALASAALARAGALVPVPGVGSLVWSDAVTGERTASIACGRLVLDGRVVPCLLYAATGPDGAQHEMEEYLELEQTQPPVGGVRWWFRCPLGMEGGRCGGRVRKLYLPPGRLYFGCRGCHDLTYASTRKRHHYATLAAAMAE